MRFSALAFTEVAFCLLGRPEAGRLLHLPLLAPGSRRFAAKPKREEEDASGAAQFAMGREMLSQRHGWCGVPEMLCSRRGPANPFPGWK